MLNWGTGLDGATIEVDIGFADPPATAIASVTWTNVTTYVRSLSIELGRSDKLDSYQAGRLSMLLDNRDRRFDPLHASGPYYGDLKPMRRVRVQFTYDGTTITMFSGYVSGWPQTYDPPADATVSITATDGFTVLQRCRLRSLYAYEVAQDNPVLWWRLNEQAGDVTVDNSDGNHDGLYVGGATFNSRTGLIIDTDTAIEFGVDQSVVTNLAWPVFPFTVEVWFSTLGNTNIPGNVNHFIHLESGSAAVDIAFAAAEADAVYQDTGGAFLGRVASPPAIDYCDGQPHHVVATWTTTTAAPTFYVDDTSIGTATTSGTGADLPAGHFVVGFDSNEPASTDSITLDECAVYGSALSAARVAVHYAAGTTPFEGLDTGAAVAKILDMAGWPSADRTIQTGISTVSAFDVSGKTALEAIQELERTEQGRFFIASDGKAIFLNRHYALTAAVSMTSQATFGDGAGELPYRDLGLEFDEDQIRNSITTARDGGSPFTVSDATSIGDYLEREHTITGLHNASDDEIRDLGLWQLAHYKDPLSRIPAIEIQPRRDPAALFPVIRDLDLVDRITAKRRPQGVGTAITLEELIEGIHHEIVVSPVPQWTTTFYGSPAETLPVFVLDDTNYGVLDTARLAF